MGRFRTTYSHCSRFSYLLRSCQTELQVVLSFKWHPSVCLSENWQSWVLCSLLGHQKRLKIHEICPWTHRNQRRGIILCYFLKTWGRNNPDRSLQCYRYHDLKQTSRSWGFCFRDEPNTHCSLFLKLYLYVAIQEPDFKTNNVRTQCPSRLPKNGKINLLVRRR